MEAPRSTSIVTRVWPAVLFTVIHLLLAAASAVALSPRAQFGRRGLLLHLMLVATGTLLGWTALLFTARRRGRTPGTLTRLAFASVATLSTCVLALLYAGSAIGNREWGSGLNYHIVLGFGALAAPNRPPFFIPWSLHVGVATSVLLLWGMYWWSWRLVAPAIAAVAAGPVRTRLLTAAIGVWMFSVCLIAWSVARAGTLTREPIAGFFITSSGELGFSQYSVDRQLPEEAVRARAAYPRGQTFSRKNVILIMVDALRADHMGVYGYARPTTPFLSGLLASNRLKAVSLALSSCAESSCGILSTLTSKPFRHLSTPNFSLLNLFADQGYDIYQVLSADHTFAGERKAYGHEQTLYFDSSSSRRFGVNDDRALFEGLERVPQYSGRAALLHFHLMSAHFAGVKHAEFRRYQPWFVRQDFASIINSTRDLVALANNYDNGVLEADDTIRRLFSELERKGYLSNSLVVILADHGEGLGDRDAGPDGVGHVHSLHQEFIRIPLLLYDAPSDGLEAPYANLQFATQIDVAPTIVDRLGLQVPSSWEGRSLLNPEPRRYSYMQTSRWSPCYALVERMPASTLKYMRCEQGQRGARDTAETERLYDLQGDPMERTDLAGTVPPATLQRMRERLHALLTDSAAAAGAGAPRANVR